MHFSTSTIAFGLLAVSQLVAGHGAIIKATGNLGGSGSALGINPDTPRNGTKRNPFQTDTTRFKAAKKTQGQNKAAIAASCGSTIQGGNNDIQAGTQKILQLNGGSQLPQISPGGSVQMTLHQVNGDGAGPYKCEINADGTGTNWKAIQVTTQVPGKNGNNGKTAKSDLPLNVAIPADQTCTGIVAGQNNVCIVKCQNPARAGPFGGCVPVQLAADGAGVAATTATAAATNGTAAVQRRDVEDADEEEGEHDHEHMSHDDDEDDE